jgi:hypothetical protein
MEIVSDSSTSPLLYLEKSPFFRTKNFYYKYICVCVCVRERERERERERKKLLFTTSFGRIGQSSGTTYMSNIHVY